MSIRDLEKAFELIEKNFTASELDFCGEQSPDTIRKAEKVLKVELPITYKVFLEKYGCGGVRSFEIYGLIKDEEFTEEKIPHVAVPNAIWTTLQWHRDFNHLLHLVIISSLGEGSVYCLDTSQIDTKGECPVVICPVGMSGTDQKLEVVAEDFGKFFFDMLQRQIMYKRSDKYEIMNQG